MKVLIRGCLLYKAGLQIHFLLNTQNIRTSSGWLAKMKVLIRGCLLYKAGLQIHDQELHQRQRTLVSVWMLACWHWLFRLKTRRSNCQLPWYHLHTAHCTNGRCEKFLNKFQFEVYAQQQTAQPSRFRRDYPDFAWKSRIPTTDMRSCCDIFVKFS